MTHIHHGRIVARIRWSRGGWVKSEMKLCSEEAPQNSKGRPVPLFEMFQCLFFSSRGLHPYLPPPLQHTEGTVDTQAPRRKPFFCTLKHWQSSVGGGLTEIVCLAIVPNVNPLMVFFTACQYIMCFCF